MQIGHPIKVIVMKRDLIVILFFFLKLRIYRLCWYSYDSIDGLNDIIIHILMISFVIRSEVCRIILQMAA